MPVGRPQRAALNRRSRLTLYVAAHIAKADTDELPAMIVASAGLKLAGALLA